MVGNCNARHSLYVVVSCPLSSLVSPLRSLLYSISNIRHTHVHTTIPVQLEHLREQAKFVRVLGLYPIRKSPSDKPKLVGPVKELTDRLEKMHFTQPKSFRGIPEGPATNPLKIGIIGLGTVGSQLAHRFHRSNAVVSTMDNNNKASAVARKLGVEYYDTAHAREFLTDLDVVVLAVPMQELEETIVALPIGKMRGKLVVEVCPLNAYPKALLEKHVHEEADILVSHPMLFPTTDEDDDSEESARTISSTGWENRPVVYEKVRIANEMRCQQYLRIFEEARCQMMEMKAEEHDQSTADADFVTQLTGRLLADRMLPPSPVVFDEYDSLRELADTTARSSFARFFGLYKYNPNARGFLNQMRENLAEMERQLASEEAYLMAKQELKDRSDQALTDKIVGILTETLEKNVGNNKGQTVVKEEPTLDVPAKLAGDADNGSRKPKEGKM